MFACAAARASLLALIFSFIPLRKEDCSWYSLVGLVEGEKAGGGVPAGGIRSKSSGTSSGVIPTKLRNWGCRKGWTLYSVSIAFRSSVRRFRLWNGRCLPYWNWRIGQGVNIEVLIGLEIQFMNENVLLWFNKSWFYLRVKGFYPSWRYFLIVIRRWQWRSRTGRALVSPCSISSFLFIRHLQIRHGEWGPWCVCQLWKFKGIAGGGIDNNELRTYIYQAKLRLNSPWSWSRVTIPRSNLSR